MFVNRSRDCRFLYVAVFALMAGLIGAARAEELPLFTFVQWNDVHVAAVATKTYRLANEKMDYLVESLNAATHFPKPDFVIGVGDMIHGET